jgi:GNAT superfamily N-acetyltransferase
MAPLRIRPAQPQESASLTELALRSKAHWGYDEAFVEACRPIIGVTDTGGHFVAERDGRVLGFHHVEGDELAGLWVEPEAIGRGVGRALLDHARAQARAAGVAELLVESDPNAEPFYLRAGARRVGERPSGLPGRVLPLLRLPTDRR